MFFGAIAIGLMLLALAYLSAKDEQLVPDAPPKAEDVLVLTGTVDDVTDGDSLVLQGRKIRLWGLDAPEMLQFCQQGDAQVPCGRQARDILKELVRGQEIVCSKKDTSYDRIVARCVVKQNGAESVDLAREVIAAGYAISEWKYSRAPYRNDEAVAQNAKLGIWDMVFERPSQWRFCNMDRHKDRRPKNCGTPYKP